ncbi:MAG: addiction module toxin RelE [Hyphomonas sp.]|nr:addiction module toxin RelE [Hyphomonas sp.]MBU3920123.1 type II toxin-antitoxin system RelE/ParE family toxin [Alphaproteobacteria bacterium]MBU4060258.1 type II toxin-antitoxin system RelE/ParE family toxin [Alphaproteobacteria bacterium]MBU4162926.1 type II toxin-antitoxin system RelE/ParE family toxin [Alphaproteobacteria bacterium]
MPLQTVVETPEFIRRAGAAGMTDEDRADLITTLAESPEAGIALGGGLRKVRVARRGGGKSGGYRVIHFYRAPDMPLFLLTVFAKNEKANITPAERDGLIELCDLIAQTYGSRK